VRRLQTLVHLSSVVRPVLISRKLSKIDPYGTLIEVCIADSVVPWGDILVSDVE